MKFKILYASDCHGNRLQYNKLFRYIVESNPSAVIYGGDIGPKYQDSNFVINQKKFLEQFLFPNIRSLKEINCDFKFYFIMGNEDSVGNLSLFDSSSEILEIHNKRLTLTNDFDIIGYSFVPITPFPIKDWEKFDLSRVNDDLKEIYLDSKKNNRYTGLRTSGNKLVEIHLDPNEEQTSSIQRDLESRVFEINPERTVLVMHCPPKLTNLDVLPSKVHVGSFAIRDFIERNQPYLTLHGHVHETVDVTGEYQDEIGKTVSICSGNSDHTERISVIEFDLYNLKNIKRITL